MQTQRDRVHAHQYLIGRMSSALVSADPSPAEPRDKGHRFGLWSGLVLAVLISVGFWVYGLVVPGGNSVWQEKGVILVEKETGNRYIYFGGELHPVRNQASALLLLGPGAHVETISRASLAGLSHGTPVGIVDAPDALPPVDGLVRDPWALCLTGGRSAAMSMVLDPPRLPEPLPANRYVLVATPGDTRYLVLGNVKYPVNEPEALIALGVPTLDPAPAPQPWLDALPTGPALTAAEINGAGQPGPAVAGHDHAVGTVFRQRNVNGNEQFWLSRPDGLEPLSTTEYALLSARDADLVPVDVTPPQVADVPRSADTSLSDRLPDVTGAGPAAPGQVCLVQVPAGATVASAVTVGRPLASTAAPRPGVTVEAPANTGMLAGAVPMTVGQRTPHRYLITELGIKYPIADDDAVAALGYGGVVPTPVPDYVLQALPTGPVLSRTAAVPGKER